MPYPKSLLVHSCNIESGSTGGTADAWNVTTGTKTYSTVSCRFVMQKGSIRHSDSGYQPVRTLGVVLPAGTSVTEGKELVGLSTGYTKTYRIKGVPRYAILKNATVSHILCDLEVVG